MSNKQARIKSMKNTTFESAMNSSSFASTESAAQKKAFLTKRNLFYRETFFWLERNYFFAAAECVARIERYHEALEKNGKIKITPIAGNDCKITIDGIPGYHICDNENSWRCAKILSESAQSIISMHKERRDNAIEKLKEYILKVSGRIITDEEREAILRINKILSYEHEK